MYQRPLRSDEIYHWGMAKGGQRENHKYIARIDLGGKFRYFYDQAEIAAYKAAKAVDNTVNKVTGHQQRNQMRSLTNDAIKARNAAVTARRNSKDYENYAAETGDKWAFKRAIAERNDANRYDDKANNAVNERARVRRDYEANTLAGKAEKAGRQVKRNVRNAKRNVDNDVDEARERVNDAVDNVKNTANNAKKRVTDTVDRARETVDNVRDAADEVGRRAKRAQNFLSKRLKNNSKKRK